MGIIIVFDFFHASNNLKNGKRLANMQFLMAKFCKSHNSTPPFHQFFKLVILTFATPEKLLRIVSKDFSIDLNFE
jgi:hypothetical protein